MSEFEIIECRNGNKYTIDDIHYRLLKNGAVQDIKTTRIVGLSLTSHIITRENASEYSRKYWKEGRMAANSGLKRLNNSDTSLDAWADIVEQQAIVALGEGREATNAAKFVGNATGLTPGMIDVQDNEKKETGNVRIELPVQVVTQLLQYIESKRMHDSIPIVSDVIDGDMKDA